MLKIKLARFGKRNQPHFRIVVNEARTKRDGEYMALLGSYAPTQTPKTLEINMEEYNKWIEKGAQPTDTVASLAKRFQSGNPFPKKTKQLSKKAKAKLVAEKNGVVADEPKKEVSPEAEAKPEEAVEAETIETKTEVEASEQTEAKTKAETKPEVEVKTEEAAETEAVETKTEVEASEQTEAKTK